jgi:chromosomal replication initiator protein
VAGQPGIGAPAPNGIRDDAVPVVPKIRLLSCRDTSCRIAVQNGAGVFLLMEIVMESETRLAPYFTFGNMVVGKANEQACAASIRVADHPGEPSHNPLFIHGEAGLGKTHLIHAIGNRIVERFPEKIVRYVHTEDYHSDFLKAYKTNSFDAFRCRYRSLDVLLLGGIHFSSGRIRMQEEFLFVFNALIKAKKQVVITCDTYPRKVPGLEDRLVSHSDGGLTVCVRPPEFEMRKAILREMAEVMGIALDDELTSYIAERLRRDVLELEGALMKIAAYASFCNRKIDLALPKEALKDLLPHV